MLSIKNEILNTWIAMFGATNELFNRGITEAGATNENLFAAKGIQFA